SLQGLTASSTARRSSQRTFSSLILRREPPSVRTWVWICLALASGQASLQDLTASSTARRTTQGTFSSLTRLPEQPSVRTWVWACLALISGVASLQDLTASYTARRTTQRTFSSLLMRLGLACQLRYLRATLADTRRFR